MEVASFSHLIGAGCIQKYICQRLCTVNIGSHFTTVRSAIPSELMPLSGKVFYSGKDAFSKTALLYVLGVNPGGDPVLQNEETVASHTDWVATVAPLNWSAYRDESWMGKRAGSHGMQPRILHMFKVLDLNPGTVPASNLVFLRSRREDHITKDLARYADLCWSFHRCILESLRPKVILCLGKTAGQYICQKVGAYEKFATFTEQNERRWQSHAYRSTNGVHVVVATHPSIADWTVSATDPTPLVAEALRTA